MRCSGSIFAGATRYFGSSAFRCGRKWCISTKLRPKTRDGTTTSASTVQYGNLQPLCQHRCAIAPARGMDSHRQSAAPPAPPRETPPACPATAAPQSRLRAPPHPPPHRAAPAQKVVMPQIGIGIIRNHLEINHHRQAQQIARFNRHIERRIVHDAHRPLHPVDDASRVLARRATPPHQYARLLRGEPCKFLRILLACGDWNSMGIGLCLISLNCPGCALYPGFLQD